MLPISSKFVERPIDEIDVDCGRGGLLKLELAQEGGWVYYQPFGKSPKVTRCPLPIKELPPLLDLPEADLFVGREKHLHQSIAALKSSQLVQIYGAAGVGKSLFVRYLLHHAAFDLSLQFPSGILYRQLQAKQTAEDIADFLFKHFYKSVCPYKPSIAAIQKLFKEKQALIVLDDARLANHEVTLLREIAPECTFLLISPEQARINAGVSIALDGLSEEEAVRLVKLVLKRALSPLEQEAAQSLCAALRGNPLEILQQLASIGEGTETLLMVNRRIQAAGEQSSVRHLLKSLTVPEQHILKTLAVFGKASLSIQQVSTIAGILDAKSVLETLRRRHLVQFDNSKTYTAATLLQLLSDPRYRLNSNLIDPLRETSLAPYVTRSIIYFEYWINRQQSIDQIGQEFDPLIELLQWDLPTDQRHLATSLRKAFDRTLLLSGQWGVRKHVLQRYVQTAKPRDLKTEQAFVLHELGVQELCLGNRTAAVDFLHQSLKLNKSLLTERHLEFVSLSAPSSPSPYSKLKSSFKFKPPLKFEPPSWISISPLSLWRSVQVGFFFMFIYSLASWGFRSLQFANLPSLANLSAQISDQLDSDFIAPPSSILNSSAYSPVSPQPSATTEAAKATAAPPKAARPMPPLLAPLPPTPLQSSLAVTAPPPFSPEAATVAPARPSPSSVQRQAQVGAQATRSETRRVPQPSSSITPEPHTTTSARLSAPTQPPQTFRSSSTPNLGRQPSSPTRVPQASSVPDVALPPIARIPVPPSESFQAERFRPATVTVRNSSTLSESMCRTLHDQWQNTPAESQGHKLFETLLEQGNCGAWKL